MPRKSASKKQRGGPKNNRTKIRSKNQKIKSTNQKKIYSQRKKVNNRRNRKSKKVGGGNNNKSGFKTGQGIYNEAFKDKLKTLLKERGIAVTLYGDEAIMSKQPQEVPYVYRKEHKNIMTLNNFNSQTKYNNKTMNLWHNKLNYPGVIPRQMSPKQYKRLLEKRRKIKAAEAAELAAKVQAELDTRSPRITIASPNNYNSSNSSSNNDDWETDPN